jgi:iron complex outermembrane receptor protein
MSIKAMKATFVMGAALAVLGVSQSASAAAQTIAMREYSIERQNLGNALRRFAIESGVDVAFDPAIVRGRTSQGVRGKLGAEAALRMLLNGSGLSLRRTSSGGYAVARPFTRTVASSRGQAYTQNALAVGPAYFAPQSQQAAADQPGADQAEEPAADPIVVTGSRIQRAGFDAPTPTTVVGEVEMRQGARANIQQVLNDLPQVRATTTQTTSGGNTGSGTAPVDLRGLGRDRTLTLIDGRRFVGQYNLNFIPMNLVKRLEVVTGGASAAWGSGAVSGVVNVILDNEIEGLSLGVNNGISSRGDVHRYAADASFGTKFADGRGHAMFGAEYVKDKGAFGNRTRQTLSAGIVRVNPTSATDLSTMLVRDVNYGNFARDGLITSGVLAGNVFNPDGTLRRFRGGTQVGAAAFNAQMIGGEDGLTANDLAAISAPYKRLTTYGRVSFDLGSARIWADASYGRVDNDNPKYIPDINVASITVQATNPFLPAAVRSQLAAAGQTSFTYGREFGDIFTIASDVKRENAEIAVGIDGDLGRFKYRAHFSHGEIHEDERNRNSRIAANYNRAIFAATNSAGQIVCAVNADAITTNDDPACRPLNIFGVGNASPEALAYITGTLRRITATKLDSTGVELRGDLFDLWAGPLTVAVGAEARWEEVDSHPDSFTAANTFVFGSAGAVKGGFSVKEGFAEAALPVLDLSGTIKAEINGAARYSDYSTSGGIWSWKVGGTVRLFNDILLRGTRSRDIRSPTITDLYSTVRTGGGVLTDLDTAGRLNIIPGYNPNPLVISNTGGNPLLVPEVSKGMTLGATWSPSFMRGFSASVDYYDLRIDGAITSLSAANLTLACSRGSQEACASIVRNPTTQTLEMINSVTQNIARIEASGIDFELSYLLPLSQLKAGWDGSLRIRALATFVDHLITDTTITRVDGAGNMANGGATNVPDWRGVLALTYQDERVALDARIRYINKSVYNSSLTTLINNDVPAKTYVDLGARFTIAEKFEIFGNVNNVFNVAHPINQSFTSPVYDAVGTYFTAGARVKF